MNPQIIHSCLQEGVSKLLIRTGVCASGQRASFQNATQQSVGSTLAISIATFVEVPRAIQMEGEDAVAAFVQKTLAAAIFASPAVCFEVRIGEEDE